LTSSLGVIADDFTGACDVGVQFRKCGLETAVLTCIERLDAFKGNFDLIVIDTESRNLAPEIAYDKVREAVKALKAIDARLVYKKIDSTLRGNLGAELDAIIDELKVKAIIVAPAFPAQNRTTINGHLLIKNVPLERTEFARDPLNPVKTSHIATLIGHQTQRRIGHIDLSKVRSTVESLKEEIQRLTGEGNEIIVADAETPDDLAKVVKASVDPNLLPCGSAGLAEEVSRLLTSRLQESKLLVISGSVNNVTLNQIATVEKGLDVKVLEPDLSGVLISEQKWDAEVKNLVGKVEEAVVDGRDVIIRLAKSKSSVLEVQRLGKELGMDNLQVAERLLSILSEAFKRIIQNYNFSGLIIIGGDTSIKIMKAMNVDGIRIEKEVLPGIPMSRILGGKFEGLRVVTKAGGFGDDYTLAKIMKHLKGEQIQ